MKQEIVYKLTNENAQSHGDTQWGPGVSHSGTGEGDLCGPGWIHYYSDPLLAVLLNSIHANFARPRLWEALPTGEEKQDRGGLKSGSLTLTTIREIPLPAVTTEQRVRFGILCALKVLKDAGFEEWAAKWLSGEDRSDTAARRAARSAAAAEAEAAAEAAAEAEAAADAAADAAAAAADAAADAAWSARSAAWSAKAAARSAARSAAKAAEAAAEDAGWEDRSYTIDQWTAAAAYSAVRADSLDLIAISKQATSTN